MTKEKITKTRKKIHNLYEENEYNSVKGLQNRARSISVGTAFGGIVEISLRTDTHHVYAQIQPTEVIEFIEQLAAGVGVEIAMRPKLNFASWRGWEEVIDQRIGWDKIAWKGTAAWQLNGDKIEENVQKQLSNSDQKSLPSLTNISLDKEQEISENSEKEEKKVVKKPRKTKKKETVSEETN